jgi:hypothetical protein
MSQVIKLFTTLKSTAALGRRAINDPKEAQICIDLETMLEARIAELRAESKPSPKKRTLRKGK